MTCCTDRAVTPLALPVPIVALVGAGVAACSSLSKCGTAPRDMGAESLSVPRGGRPWRLPLAMATSAEDAVGSTGTGTGTRHRRYSMML